MSFYVYELEKIEYDSNSEQWRGVIKLDSELPVLEVTLPLKWAQDEDLFLNVLVRFTVETYSETYDETEALRMASKPYKYGDVALEWILDKASRSKTLGEFMTVVNTWGATITKLPDYQEENYDE